MSYVGKVEAGEEESLVGTTLFGVCSTPAATAAKVVTIPGLDTVFTGLSVHIQFTNSNKAEQPTLQIQGSGLEAKPIFRHGNFRPGVTEAESWFAGAVLELTYDGSGWQITGWLNTDTNTTYPDATPGVSGLMPGTDKTKLDNMSIQTYSQLAVAESRWTTDSTYPGYGFKANLVCGQATNLHVPIVTFAPEQIEAYGPAPVAKSENGFVTVYVQNKPTETIRIPTVLLVKG